MYLNYYDIFVRHAFGSYFDILKEVSYSPMMAEMLSFMDSKSSAWVLEDAGSKVYPGKYHKPHHHRAHLYHLNLICFFVA